MEQIKLQQDEGKLLVVLQDFVSLCKPKVLMLVMLTAVVGAALAAFSHPVAPLATLLALTGIAGVAAAAAAFNCLVEAATDGVMGRTRWRPLPNGRINTWQAVLLITLLGGSGLLLTITFGGVLAGVLTCISFFGYAVIYTLYLKKATPQNIVIGGASGAMPPLLGWVAASGEISYAPLLLFLIIFVWTPPHFWALALYRKNDYARAKMPMLPVTHGDQFTALQIILYTLMLFIVTLLPYLTQMAGVLYLLVAVALNCRFMQLAWRLKKSLAGEDGRRLFTYSVLYLALLFAALLLDAMLQTVLA
ncbi:MAG: heme o synthase [Proteobacteria bacterium]|nr:heme o synthase [Pseudomonadota bacterium]